MNPQRREYLFIDEPTGIVHDPERHRFFRLSSAMAAALALCDGERTVEELLVEIPRQAGLPEDPEWGLYCLRGLRRRGLLKQPPEVPTSGMDRREAMRRLRSLGLKALLPVIAVMAAPTPAQAGSRLGKGASCTDSAQCASGLCIGGACE